MSADLEERTTLVREEQSEKSSGSRFVVTRRRTVVLGCMLLFILCVLIVAQLETRFSIIKKSFGYSDEDEDESQLLNDIDDLIQNREDYSLNCTAEEFGKLEPGSQEYLVKEADCGSGYVLNGSSPLQQKPVHVVLFGEFFRDNFKLSGCQIGNRCPHHPHCQMSLLTNERDPFVHIADVLVVATPDAIQITKLASKARKPKVRKILYWREAYWAYTPLPFQRNAFDLEMGVHFTSGIVNPNYMRRPKTLMTKSFVEFLPFKERNEFALSIISNCAAHSERQTLVVHLTDFLGPDRVHQYGKCGTRKLPPPPLRNAAKVIAKYKFYLSFENTIQNGYVSEKLFTVLNMPLIPVYMGASNVPNITKTPSFIKVSDFHSVKSLAEYMLFLDANPNEYAKYHVWRTDISSFTEEYLNLIKYKFPGQAEMKPYCRATGCNRVAACCRLCNLQYLDEMIERRTVEDLIPKVKSQGEISKEFFGGKLKRPGAKARLTPPPTAASNDSEEDDDNE